MRVRLPSGSSFRLSQSSGWSRRRIRLRFAKQTVSKRRLGKLGSALKLKELFRFEVGSSSTAIVRLQMHAELSYCITVWGVINGQVGTADTGEVEDFDTAVDKTEAWNCN